LINYISYSDESYSKDQRFRSIAAFSFEANYFEFINSQINEIFQRLNIREFKWQKLKDIKYNQCAIELIDFIWEYLTQIDGRIDVIIWDTQDSRHTIRNRDDMSNYERMFFHLHSYLLKQRPTDSRWILYPDEGVGIDWKPVRQCMNAVGKSQKSEFSLFPDFFDNPHYSIEKIDEVSSKEPCCQIADLFAGFSIFSKTDYDMYEKWLNLNTPTLPLFPEEVQPNFSRAQKFRFPIIKYFNEGCKDRKLGVSLKSNRCFQTPNPKNQINFWQYSPQHENDKAPVKDQSARG